MISHERHKYQLFHDTLKMPYTELPYDFMRLNVNIQKFGVMKKRILLFGQEALN